MSPRAYTLGARAAAVAETRQRVIAAAQALCIEGDFYRSSMEELARRADVARATIYHQFGSKLGVLEAVITDFEERAGLDALASVVDRAPPQGLIRAAISSGCDYWATDPDLARKIVGLGSIQPEVADVLDRHDEGRLRLLNRLVDRLLAGGVLRDDCSPEHALDVLWLVTSFDAYDLLTRGRRLSHARATNALVRLAEDQLGRRHPAGRQVALEVQDNRNPGSRP